MLDAIPLEALTDDIAILGKKGAGKTYTARGEAERLQDLHRRVCVVDPTGVWYGMRLAADGKTASPYQMVVFGGDHADVELPEGVSGAKLAELVAGGAFSCIIDTKRLTVRERTRIWTEFAERLAQVNRKPIHLLIDEAHLFAPQGRVNDPASGQMVHATNNLVSGGRALGVRIMLITQRPAKLHKDSLSGVETMVALRMVAPQDRAAVEDWVREQADAAKGREIVASLPSLPTGEGWIWSPQLDVLERARFRPIRTFDTSRTPEDGAIDVRPFELLPAAGYASLRAALAPAEPVDPKAKNKTGLRTGTAPVPDSAPSRAALDDAYAAGGRRGLRAGYEAGYAAGYSAAIADAEASLKPLLCGSEGRRPSMEKVEANVRLLLTAWKSAPDAPIGDSAPAPATPPPAAPPLAIASGASSPMQLRLLEAMRRAPRRELMWSEVALLAGASPVSGPFRGARRALDGDGSIVTLLQGRDVAHASWDGQANPLLAEDVLPLWQAKLGSMAARVFAHLAESRRTTTPPDVAYAIGVSATSGPYRGAWKQLRNNLLVEAAGDPGAWRLAAILRELPRAFERAA